jgi:hypothetical protein
LEAFGRLEERTEGAEVGSLRISTIAAEAAEVIVVTRKTCTTWKMK